MIYTIQPGHHYSKPRRLRLYLWKKHWRWQCKFIDVHGKSDGSTNKLVGIGFLPGHHTNSVRVGWVYNSGRDNIELRLYAYIKGERRIETLCEVAHNRPFDVVYSHGRLSIQADGLELGGANVGLSGWFGYGLGFYYGGVGTSGNEIKVEIK